MDETTLDRQKIGARIRAARQRAMLTQSALGETLGGFTKSAVAQWEAGTTFPGLESFAGLCVLLNESADALLFGVSSVVLNVRERELLNHYRGAGDAERLEIETVANTAYARQHPEEISKSMPFKPREEYDATGRHRSHKLHSPAAKYKVRRS